MTHLHSFRMTIATISIVIGCSASAAVADEDKTEGNADPLESLNRFTSGFNSFLRKGFVDPMVDLYQYVTPGPARECDLERSLEPKRTDHDWQ